MNAPLVSVVVLNYNGKIYLERCLSSLLNQTYPYVEIILVDNASSDGSVDFVRARFLTVKTIENEKNLGFAAGNNVGIRIAQGKYIVTLNNDTEAHPEWLEHLVRVAENDETIGMCASKVLSFDDPRIIDSVGVVIYPDGMSRGRGRLEEDTGQYDQVEEVLLPSACAALYRRKMLNEIGLFDESFFAYCEDTDLGLRGRLAGWRAVLVPSAIVYHLYSRTGGRYSALKAFLVERNHLWVALKSLPLSMLLKLPFYTLWRYLVQTYGVFNHRGAGRRFVETHSKVQLLWIVLKAYGSALKGLPSTLQKRKNIQAKKQISDKVISRWFEEYGLSAGELVLKD